MGDMDGRVVALVGRGDEAQRALAVACAEAGASIVPAMPSFYDLPGDMEDLVKTMTGRILNSAGVQNDLYRRWGD